MGDETKKAKTKRRRHLIRAADGRNKKSDAGNRENDAEYLHAPVIVYMLT